MSASMHCKANRDFERQIDHMVIAVAEYYHKEIDSFLDSSYAITKHGAGPIKRTEKSFRHPHQVGSKEVRALTGETRIGMEIADHYKKVDSFPIGFPSVA